MATGLVWKIKRYGRLVPDPREKRAQSWKIFEATGNEPEIVLTIVESGYLLVMQGHKSLDTISFLCGSDFLKVHQKSDNLMLRLIVKGESRIIRMQFDGSSRAEAVQECSRAVEKLKEYMSVTTQGDPPPSSNQPPTEVSAPVKQTFQEKAVGNEPEVAQGSLPLKRLIQHFLGETAVTLPQVYHHSPLAQGDLEPILRVCLLDPSFHAFVEKHFLGETAVTLPQVYHHSPLAQGDLEPILRVCLLDPSFHAFVEKVEGELRKLLEE